MPIYTIGNTKSYRKALKENNPLRNLGKVKGYYNDQYPLGYPGGIIWKTAKDALIYLTVNKLHAFSVFEIDGNWKIDSYYDGQSESKRSLLNTATITQEVL